MGINNMQLNIARLTPKHRGQPKRMLVVLGRLLQI
jgi:hypothetical protein